jgi:hypothetical protein
MSIFESASSPDRRRPRARRATALLLLILASAPSVTLAQSDAVAELRAELATLRAEYEGRIAELEARLAELESERAAPTPAPAVPAPPRPAAAAARTQTYFNPEISVIGNFVGVAGSNDVAPSPSLALSESELAFRAVVDPYARADFYIAFGEEGAEIEEGYATLTALPAQLLAKAGRMRVQFGKINTLHFHSLPWVDKPLPIVNLLGGEEGWIGDGLSLARLFAVGDTVGELTAQVFRGEAEGLFEGPSSSDLAYNGHLKLFRDLSEASNLELGLSYASGPNGSTGSADTDLAGIDLTYRWKPLRLANYRALELRAEVFRSDREQPAGEARSLGGFLSADARLARRWWLGARVEAAERADDDALRDEGGALLLTFDPTEFSRFRAELRRRRYAEGITADELLLQLQFLIGAHGAHPF